MSQQVCREFGLKFISYSTKRGFCRSIAMNETQNGRRNAGAFRESDFQTDPPARL